MDEEWALEHKTDFFPQNDIGHWTVSFGELLEHHRPHRRITRSSEEISSSRSGSCRSRPSLPCALPVADVLGQRLVTYGASGMFPLRGEKARWKNTTRRPMDGVSTGRTCLNTWAAPLSRRRRTGRSRAAAVRKFLRVASEVETPSSWRGRFMVGSGLLQHRMASRRPTLALWTYANLTAAPSGTTGRRYPE